MTCDEALVGRDPREWVVEFERRMGLDPHPGGGLPASTPLSLGIRVIAALLAARIDQREPWVADGEHPGHVSLVERYAGASSVTACSSTRCRSCCDDDGPEPGVAIVTPTPIGRPGRGSGRVDLMALILGLVTLTLVLTAGVALLKAGRDIDAADDSEVGTVAGLVDGGLQRTRVAVDTLIQPEVSVTEVEPSPHALRERATTYAVFGLGLLGVAAFVVLGFWLVG